MTQPLPAIGELIAQSWHQFVKTWDHLLPVSSWFLFAPALMLLISLLARSWPDAGPVIIFFSDLLNVLLVFWTIIRLTNRILLSDANKPVPKDEMQKAWILFLPFFWISILVRFAILGGTILFVLPGVWLSIKLLFSPYFLLEDDVHGTQALAASMALVKGRWWPTFWRIVIPGFVFLMVFLFGMSLFSFLLSLIAGASKVAYIFNPSTLNDTQNPLALSVWYLIQALGLMVFVPLFLTWPVKLFHALKQSR